MKNLFLRGRYRKAMAWAMACVLLVTTILVPSRGTHALTLSEEKELGQKVLEQIRRMMPLVEDGEIAAYVGKVGNRIAKQFEASPYQWQFFCGRPAGAQRIRHSRRVCLRLPGAHRPADLGR